MEDQPLELCPDTHFSHDQTCVGRESSLHEGSQTPTPSFRSALGCGVDHTQLIPSKASKTKLAESGGKFRVDTWINFVRKRHLSSHTSHGCGFSKLLGLLWYL